MAVSQKTIDDGGGGTSPTGGSGGGPATINPRWLDINWSFPSTFENLILGFDVIAYTGSNPDDPPTYCFNVVRVNPNVRRLVKSIIPTTSLPTINASVRAVYA